MLQELLFYLLSDVFSFYDSSVFGISYFTCLRMVFLFMLVFVSAFLCYLTKKRRQRKQKIFLFEEKKHLLKKSPSTNLPIDQPFILEVVFRATSTAQALSVPSLSILKITSVLNKVSGFLFCFCHFFWVFFNYPERFFDYQFVRSTPRSKVTKNVTTEQKLSLGTMIVWNGKWAFFGKTFS